MTYEYSLKSLNFFAFMKPNKHKMRSKGFFHNLAGFVFEYFCDSRRILATFAKFCLNSLFATWSYRFTRHPACTRSSSPPSPTQVSWCKKFLQNPPPSLNCYQCYGLNLLLDNEIPLRIWSGCRWCWWACGIEHYKVRNWFFHKFQM